MQICRSGEAKGKNNLPRQSTLATCPGMFAWACHGRLHCAPRHAISEEAHWDILAADAASSYKPIKRV